MAMILKVSSPGPPVSVSLASSLIVPVVSVSSPDPPVKFTFTSLSLDPMKVRFLDDEN